MPATGSLTGAQRVTSLTLATTGPATMNDQAASRSVSWPGGKRIAVLVSILFETWSDGKGPSYFPRTTPLKPGTVDRGAIQWAQYGGNEGLWRILRTLDRHSVPATIFCSGRCGELYPQVIAAAAQAGHDIAGHGYTQDGLFCYMTPDEEHVAIRKTLDALEQASGIRAQGWATPAYSWTEHTFDLLLQNGVRWYGDALDISLPRRRRAAISSPFPGATSWTIACCAARRRPSTTSIRTPSSICARTSRSASSTSASTAISVAGR
jgi:hypothetical protein